MVFNRKNYSNELLLNLYQSILKPRLIEERMILLAKQGKIPKWFSAWGQEAISAGIVLGLQSDDWIFPSHRNLGVFVNRNLPLEKLISQWQGKQNGFSNGRERSFHFGSKKHHIGAMISHTAAHFPVACGLAWGNILQNKNKITVAICGDGATSEGDFHEALNIASVWNLPIIFVVENNGYGISTETKAQFNCNSIIDKAPGYGLDALQIDGNNILEMYEVISQISQNIRVNPRPVLIEAMTFRMRAHEESADNSFVPSEILEKWALKDPIVRFEKFLLDEFVINSQTITQIKTEINTEIDKAILISDTDFYPVSSEKQELEAMYMPHIQKETYSEDSPTQRLRMIDSIRNTMDDGIEINSNLVIYGQDIAKFGGIFKATEGLFEKHGENHIRNTPLCESALVGMALGLSMVNQKSIVEIQFSDFVSNAFNQIINNLAKSYYRWGQNADTVIRLPTGASVGAGPFHSQSLEAYFFHCAGLKIVYPSNAIDAKGLLNAAIDDPNPVLFFEHKALYRSDYQDVSTDNYFIPIGKSKIIRKGNDASIITYGLGVKWALDLCESENLDVEIIDLRSLSPWDKEAVFESVEKTGKALVLHEDTITGSISAEISACISEHCFTFLDAPVARVGSLDTPVPFANVLENQFLPVQRLKEKLNELLKW